MTTLDARSREVEAGLRLRIDWDYNDSWAIEEAADLIAEQRAENERLTAAMVLIPRMTLGKQGKR